MKWCERMRICVYLWTRLLGMLSMFSSAQTRKKRSEACGGKTHKNIGKAKKNTYFTSYASIIFIFQDSCRKARSDKHILLLSFFKFLFWNISAFPNSYRVGSNILFDKSRTLRSHSLRIKNICTLLQFVYVHIHTKLWPKDANCEW